MVGHIKRRNEAIDSTMQRHVELGKETIRFENCCIEMELCDLAPAAWSWPNDTHKIQEFTVVVLCLDQYFSCSVDVALSKDVTKPCPTKPYPSTENLEKLAFSVHGRNILDFLRSTISSMDLADFGVGLVTKKEYIWFHTEFIPPPLDTLYKSPCGNLDIMKMKGSITISSCSLFDFDRSNPETEYKCEADKPIGERDVDKSLKEQQDKLWKKFLGI